MQKNLALIVKYFKKIYKPTENNLRTSSNSRNKNVDTTPRYKNDNQFGQFRNQRTTNVVGARENVGSPVVQQSGIQCFNGKEFGHFDTDKEIDEQELEAHYSYMLKIQEVPTADPSTDSEPLGQVQNDTRYNVFVNDLQNSEQFESISNTCIVETNDSNVILDLPDMCVDDMQNDQNNVESDDERVALATLKLDVDENKKIQKQLKKENTTLAQEFKECKTILAKTSKTLGKSNSVRDSCLVALQNKHTEFEKCKAFNDRTINYDRLERKLNETLGQLAQKYVEIKEGLKLKAYEILVVKEKHDELIKHSLLTKSHYEGLVKQKKVPTYNGRPTFANLRYLKQAQSEIPCLYAFPYDQSTHANRLIPDEEETLALERESRSKLNKDSKCLMPLAINTHNDSFIFVHELKQVMHADLKYVESLKNKIDELESDKAEFSNMYDMILKEIKECDCLAQKLSKQTESVSNEVHAELSRRFAKLEKHSISLELALQKCKEQTKSVSKTNVSEGLSKPVTAQTLPQTARQAVSNTNMLKPRMYKIDNRTTQTKALQSPQTVRNTNPHVSTTTGVNHKTNVSRPQHRSNQMKDKVMANNSKVKLKKTRVEDRPRIPSISNKIKSVTACNDSLNSRTSNANAICATCGKCLVDSDHFACVTKMLNDVNARTKKPNVVPISTRKPKGHANKSVATPHKKKVASKSTTQKPKSYYKISYLYTISLQESTSSTPLCLMAKASPTQGWLWHRRLSHLNFDYINLLSKKDVVIGLPKLKFLKDQLCSSCEVSKAKRSSFKSKAVPSSKGRLNLLHIDLCGPMRVASINERKYILMIVDDYSRYTWTSFLRSKDETQEVLKEFLTMIQRNLQALVITVRTDRGTEFLNKTLNAFF
uniref:Retrovirus-related Pol polyprotein from transposon TNT 1-94 n=1 Tax=Tanacetum cinerariifolium TaxID=118510 RepID=A0A6L2KH10_TANCI|nr:retrovirus-related Pol polyprotein from transposon TNT 1-94 [Tanacetum cinerariifolium]